MAEERVFQKKDIIYSASLGVCLVQDVTRLARERNAPIPYYVLKTMTGDDIKVAYIPVENHRVELRELITTVEATQKLEAWKKRTEKEREEINAEELGEVMYLLGLTKETVWEGVGDE